MRAVTQLSGTLAAAVSLALVAGCGSSGDPMTADDIAQRTADAMREAGTFSFEYAAGEGAATSTGAISYNDDGEVEALSVRTEHPDRETIDEYRYVDRTLYKRTGEDTFERRDEEEQDLIAVWDWAGVNEDELTITNLTEAGEDSVEGEDATAYEVTVEGGPGQWEATWWVGDEDRLLRIEKGQGAGAMLTGYGEDVDISVPDGAADEG